MARPKQEWKEGKIIHIGFMKLKILAKEPSNDTHTPDSYVLQNVAKGSLYRFQPYHGLRRIKQTFNRRATDKQYAEKRKA